MHIFSTDNFSSRAVRHCTSRGSSSGRGGVGQVLPLSSPPLSSSSALSLSLFYVQINLRYLWYYTSCWELHAPFTHASGLKRERDKYMEWDFILQPEISVNSGRWWMFSGLTVMSDGCMAWEVTGEEWPVGMNGGGRVMGDGWSTMDGEWMMRGNGWVVKSDVWTNDKWGATAERWRVTRYAKWRVRHDGWAATPEGWQIRRDEWSMMDEL